MGNSPRDCGPGGQLLGFSFIWWGIVLGGELSYNRKEYISAVSQLANMIV